MREMSKVVRDAIASSGELSDRVVTPHKQSVTRVSNPGDVALSRQEREEAEEELLAIGATRSRGAGNRAREEEPDELRTCFERDLDRIKYSKPWRRLAGKCQVFVAPDDEHLRNRMTHAIEVAQVATSIARAVGLNVALCEAIALGHDCGHGPGGHASEDAFEPYIDGGYDHAGWGADVVLADMNLTLEVLDGIRQHSWRLAAPMTPEGEVVSLADRIAYVCHDADDAARAGIIIASNLPIEVIEFCGTKQSSQIRSFINDAVRTIQETGQVGLSPGMAAVLDTFRRFNYDKIYLRPASNQQAERVIRMLRSLVEHYADKPGLIPDVSDGSREFPDAGSKQALFESVRYVSGMTDRFAISQAVTLLRYPVDLLPSGV
jgi:dGTPase